MNRKQLISIFFIALLLGMLFCVLYILSPFMGPIFWGMVLAFAFYPVHEKMLRLFRDNQNLASITTTLLILTAFVPFMVFLFLTAAKEAVHCYEWLSEAIQSGQAELAFQNFRELSWVRRIENSNLVQWDTVKDQLRNWIMNSKDVVGNFALKRATLLTKNLVTGVFYVFLTFFLIFFFLRDGKKIYLFVYQITPMDEKNKQLVFRQLSDTFSATLRGQVFTALVQAGILGLVFWFLHLPLPVFFAAITFLAAMIPVFGAATVWMPFVVYLGMTQQTQRAVLLFFLGVFGISAVDNVLKPLLIGQKTKLPYSLLFLGILGGLQMFGFIGVFLAPAFLSLFFVLVKIYHEIYSDTEEIRS